MSGWQIGERLFNLFHIEKQYDLIDFVLEVKKLVDHIGNTSHVSLSRKVEQSNLESFTVGVLRNGGFLTVDTDGFLYLTDIGREVAEKIYERHQFFTEQLIAMGVDKRTAEQDVCKIEHVISEEPFQKIKNVISGEYSNSMGIRDLAKPAIQEK